MTNKTLGRSSERLFCLLMMVLSGVATLLATPPTMTTISDVVYRANGQPATGTIVVSWPAFNTADNKPVAAGVLSIPIGAEGTVNFALVPNEGGDPGGTYYKAIYKLTDGTTFTEYWVVPATSPTTVAAIRASVVPRQVGAQFVNRQYVDTAVATTHDQVVHKAGSETIAGIKSFSASPEVPTPASGAAAVNKDYVTGAVSAISDGFVDKSGDTMNGPLTVPNDPAAPGHAANRQYVDLQVADIASGLSLKLGRINDTPISLGAVRYANQFASGEGASNQVSAACADLAGAPGSVFVPSVVGTGDLSGSLLNKCLVWDLRGTGTMNSNPPTYTTAYTGGLSLYQRSTTPLTAPYSQVMFNAYFDTYAGGINALANKANYQQGTWITRAATPGQHTGIAAIINKYSMGDGQPLVGIVDYAGGNLPGIGDEGQVAGRFVARQLGSVFTATVASINGNVITYSAPVGEGFVGEGRYLINKTTGVYSTGTASVAAAGTTVTGAGTTWSLANLPDIGTSGSWVFSLDAEEISGSKLAMPIASRAGDTELTMVDAWSNYGTTTAGSYKLYKSSIVTAVDPDNNQVTVADGTRFQAGDSIELPNSNRPSVTGLLVTIDQKLAAPTAPVGIDIGNNNSNGRGRLAQAFLMSGNANVVLQQSSHTVAPNIGINFATGPAPATLFSVADNADTASIVHTTINRRAALGGTARITYNNQNGGDMWQFGSNAINSLQVKTNVVAVGIGATVAANTALLVTPQTAGDKGIVINGNSSGDLLDVQTATASKFKVAGDGAVTAAGTIAAAGFAGPLTGTVTGNATTATTLQTARTINSVSFNGSANITVTATLPANPSACGAGEFVNDIAADGTLTCGTPAGGSGDAISVAGVAATDPNIIDGTTSDTVAGVDFTLDTGATPDTITGVVAAASGTAAGVVTTGAQTFAGAKTFSSTIGGNIDTSTALAANPADCATGEFATAIAASGALTCESANVIDKQDAAGAITGTGADATVFTSTIPAIPANRCVRATVWFLKTGGDSATFRWKFGDGSPGVYSYSATTVASAASAKTSALVCNDAGTQAAQTITGDFIMMDASIRAGNLPVAITETASVSTTLSFTFSVANTSSVTPLRWLVEKLW